MLKRTFAVIAFFCVLTALYFYPVFPHFGSAIIGPPEDNTQFVWFLWYGVKALFDPSLEFFHTRMIYFPEGMGLWYANYFYTGVAMSAVLQPLFGLAAAYNLTLLLSFVLAGWFAYLFLFEVTRDRMAALFGAFVYAFNPMHFAHALHHPPVASIQYIPLFGLFLLRAHRTGGWGNRIGAAIGLALSAYSEWNYLIYGGMCLAISYLWTAWKERNLVSVRGLWNLATIGCGAALLTAPVVIPMILMGLEHPNVPSLPGHNIFVADLLGFFVPHAYHALAGLGPVKAATAGMTGPVWEQAVYLGWVNILLAAVAVWKMRTRVFPYLAGFLFFAVLALGVELHIQGRLTGIPLPYAVLESLPFVKQARNPSRTMAFGYLFWSALISLGIRELFKPGLRQLKRRLGLAAFAGLVFMDFYSIGSDMTPVKLPPAYDAVLQDPGYARGEFAIMNIPWDKGRYLMEQTIHGLPDLQGYLGRKFSVPLIGKLPFDDLSSQKKILTEHGVKYILVRKQRMGWDPSSAEEVRIYNGISLIARNYARSYQKIYEDDKDAVFKVY